LVDRVSTTSGEAEEGSTGHFPENPACLDPGSTARVARLLRWYPTNWRERYGDEFAAVLASSLSDGKGGLRLSFNVAREGMAARLEEAGFVGRLAPPLQRARASVITVFLAVLGFLASVAVLARYAKGWQRTPALETLTRASQAFEQSKAEHAFQRTFASAAFQQLQRAANRSNNGNLQAWKALERAQTQATNALNKTEAGRTYQQAVHNLRSASGAPVFFKDIAQVASIATLVCLGIALAVATVVGVRALRQGNRKGLRAPISLLLGSVILFVFAAIAYQAGQKIPPGQPGSEWTILKWMLEGHFRFWPVVVFPVCAAASIVLATIGGVKLLGRVDLGSRLYRLEGTLAAVTAGCIGLALVSTLSWVTTLSVQAPGFLTAKDQGIFGTPLLVDFCTFLRP
jgi:hypothetical protein